MAREGNTYNSDYIQVLDIMLKHEYFGVGFKYGRERKE